MTRKSNALDLCYIAIGAVVITICAWIMIPTVIPVTLQTFGIFTVLKLLGGRRGFFSIVLYILLGAVGLPVFAGFSGGPAALFNVTGGYIVGFLLMGLIYWILTASFCTVKWMDVIALIIGLIACYIFGSLWYAKVSGSINLFGKSLLISVLPFVLPDVIKLVLSQVVSKMILKHTRI